MALVSSPSSIRAGHGQEDGSFSRYAWAVLGYNIVVVLWGAYVRATGSGAGCGSHWPLCNGVVVPRSPAAETIIEFTHRVTSGLALLAVFGLSIWAVRAFPKGHRSRLYAQLSFLFILIEAGLGAGLVLLEYVDQNASVGRAVYLSLHLVNTQILLGVLSLAAWYSTRPAPVTRVNWKLKGMLPMTLLVGVTGAVAALGDTLFPAASFAEGMRQDVSSTSHFLVRLRVFHPFFAVFSAAYIFFVTLPVVRRNSGTAWAAWGVLMLQLIAGAINVLLLAPTWMQLVHLFIANVLWLLLVVVIAEEAQGPTR
jgi:heme A synthase